MQHWGWACSDGNSPKLGLDEGNRQWEAGWAGLLAVATRLAPEWIWLDLSSLSPSLSGSSYFLLAFISLCHFRELGKQASCL